MAGEKGVELMSGRKRHGAGASMSGIRHNGGKKDKKRLADGTVLYQSNPSWICRQWCKGTAMPVKVKEKAKRNAKTGKGRGYKKELHLDGTGEAKRTEASD